MKLSWCCRHESMNLPLHRTIGNFADHHQKPDRDKSVGAAQTPTSQQQLEDCGARPRAISLPPRHQDASVSMSRMGDYHGRCRPSPSAPRVGGRFSDLASRPRFRRYAAPLRFWPRIGRLRRRLPVAAKIALATAGWITAAPGSPTPPHFLPPVSAKWTEVFGASLRRTTG